MNPVPDIDRRFTDSRCNLWTEGASIIAVVVVDRTPSEMEPIKGDDIAGMVIAAPLTDTPDDAYDGGNQ